MAIKHTILDRFGATKTIERLTARKAVLEYCKQCAGFSAREARRCLVKLCPLHPFRVRGKPTGQV